MGLRGLVDNAYRCKDSAVEADQEHGEEDRDEDEDELWLRRLRLGAVGCLGEDRVTLGRLVRLCHGQICRALSLGTGLRSWCVF